MPSEGFYRKQILKILDGLVDQLFENLRFMLNFEGGHLRRILEELRCEDVVNLEHNLNHYTRGFEDIVYRVSLTAKGREVAKTLPWPRPTRHRVYEENGVSLSMGGIAW